MREKLCLGWLHPGDMCGDELIAVAAYAHIARLDRDGVERRCILLRSRPEQGGSISQVARPGGDHPNKYAQASKPPAAKREEPVVGHDARRLCILRVCQSICREELQERIVSVPHTLFKGGETLLQFGVSRFSMTRGPRLGEAHNRQSQGECRCNSERGEDQNAR